MTALKKNSLLLDDNQNSVSPILRLEQMSSSVNFILHLKLQEKFLSDIVGHREMPFCIWISVNIYSVGIFLITMLLKQREIQCKVYNKESFIGKNMYFTRETTICDFVCFAV